jgi:hypothetical protein
MFSEDKEITLSLKKVVREPQLVIIPISEEEGVLAVVKPYGLGQASCVAFSPATKRSAPFEGYKPNFLRKICTNDFALRQGQWIPLGLDSANAVALRNAVVVLMNDIETSKPESIVRIDMDAMPNLSTATEAACVNYKAQEHTPFEKALVHLLGLDTSSAKTAQSANSDGNATA